jgi:hypothetical protein
VFFLKRVGLFKSSWRNISTLTTHKYDSSVVMRAMNFAMVRAHASDALQLLCMYPLQAPRPTPSVVMRRIVCSRVVASVRDGSHASHTLAVMVSAYGHFTHYQREKSTYDMMLRNVLYDKPYNLCEVTYACVILSASVAQFSTAKFNSYQLNSN